MSRVFDTELPFPTLARTALADAQLRANLAHATTTIRDKRLKVVAELDDWEELRSAGAAIKDYSLDHLDELCVELEKNVVAHGGVVHWARDAAEANSIVVSLVQATGVDSVVKVKSMATAEIELNGALEGHGIIAYETDLAELIVQLGDDLPSHILVPAIHKNRSQIRQIFLDEMGKSGLAAPEDLTNDPAQLASAARAHLRQRFLSAKVAISGANFIIADTGALVVVESEGNGRMCLTLPETLISVVGIEKILPNWQSLEVFMQLLPRSSTGERMNPYTSIFTGATPGNGPSNFHLVLIDNGRSSALAEFVGEPDALPEADDVVAARRRPRSPKRTGATSCAASAARPVSMSARSTSARAGTPTATPTPVPSARCSSPSYVAACARRSRTPCPMPRRSAVRATWPVPSRSIFPRFSCNFVLRWSTRSAASIPATPNFSQ